jgi:hypothetical protein
MEDEFGAFVFDFIGRAAGRRSVSEWIIGGGDFTVVVQI